MENKKSYGVVTDILNSDKFPGYVNKDYAKKMINASSPELVVDSINKSNEFKSKPKKQLVALVAIFGLSIIGIVLSIINSKIMIIPSAILMVITSLLIKIDVSYINNINEYIEIAETCLNDKTKTKNK